MYCTATARQRKLKQQLRASQKEKQRIRQELDSHRAVREQLTKQQREMKTKCEYLTVDQVDEAIARLEQRMTHTSMSLNEEKKAIEDIKRLKVPLPHGHPALLQLEACKTPACAGHHV